MRTQRGFGLLGILFAVALMAFFAYSFYHEFQADEKVEEVQHGIEGINEAEDIAEKLNEVHDVSEALIAE